MTREQELVEQVLELMDGETSLARAVEFVAVSIADGEVESGAIRGARSYDQRVGELDDEIAVLMDEYMETQRTERKL